jgi:hypothetical protein
MYLASYLQPLAEDLPVLAINGLEPTSVRYLRNILLKVAHNALDLSILNPTKWEELAGNYAASLIGDAGGEEGQICNTVLTSLLKRSNHRTSPLEAWSDESYLSSSPAVPAFVFNLVDAEGIHSPAILSLQAEHRPRSFQDLNLGKDRAQLDTIRHQGYAFALIRAPEIAKVLRQQDDPELFGPAGPMLALLMAIAKVLDHHHPDVGFLDHLNTVFRMHQAGRFEVHEPIERKLVAGLSTFLYTTDTPPNGLHNLGTIVSHITATEGVSIKPNVLSRKLRALKLLAGDKVRSRTFSTDDAKLHGWNCFYKLNLKRLNELADEFQLDLPIADEADTASAFVNKYAKFQE